MYVSKYTVFSNHQPLTGNKVFPDQAGDWKYGGFLVGGTGF